MANIRLLAVEEYDPLAGILFSVSVDSKEVKCTISNDALSNHFGVNRNNPMLAFYANRDVVLQIAGKLIKENRFKSGRIIINSQDLENFKNSSGLTGYSRVIV